jgi:4-amino-4-deoxy-L-arabinose transferase-like glycosyltransferase
MNNALLEQRRRNKVSIIGVFYIAAPLLLIGIACARLYPTYATFTGTVDETLHIAAGLQWLDRGIYTYNRDHPPLARIAVAIGPYLAGVTSQVPRSERVYPVDFLFLGGGYFRNLPLARIGNLPFFVLMCAVVYLWALRWFNRSAALWALLLFTCLPPILGHAGLATLDVACAATVAAALYQLLRWLEEPRPRQAATFGLALGLAFLSKFSSLGFLPICFALAIAYLLVAKRDVIFGAGMLTTRIKQLGITAAVAFIVVWAGYRFSLKAISPTNGQHPTIDARVANPILRHAAYTLLEVPVPLLVEIKKGMDALVEQNASGRPSYLFGEYRTTGWWYFFPVVIAVKTPLAFLILTIVGAVLILRRPKDIPWHQYLTVIFPIAILLVCMASRINLGVRHILSVYPMFVVLAGFGMARLTGNLQRRVFVVAGSLLVAWVVADSIATHPDYLAYFNQIASRHPEAILAESDLDWGQDLHRLIARLQDLGVQEVAIQYFGTFPLERANLPPHREVPSDTPVSGYVAISAHYLVLMNAKDGSFGWLKKFEPQEKIGRSIYLFNVQPN